MENKTLILVEYYNHLEEGDDHGTTFELFEDIEKAFKFAKGVKVCRIDLVKSNNTYYEEIDGKQVLNYEDNFNYLLFTEHEQY